MRGVDGERKGEGRRCWEGGECGRWIGGRPGEGRSWRMEHGARRTSDQAREAGKRGRKKEGERQEMMEP